MEVLCLMGLHPTGYEDEIAKNCISGMQTAANKFQWGIVNGITNNENVHVRILNSMYIGSFPKRYRKLIIPTFPFCHKDGADDLNVGFVNLTGYKVISRYVGVRRKIKKWINQLEGKSGVIIAYAMTSPFVEILNYVKKHYPHIKCCLVVPDLPEYMNASRYQSRSYHIRKSIQCNHFRRMLKPVDGYIFLTDAMKDWFNWNVKYCVVEGISLRTKADLMPQSVTKKKNILYAGMIEAKYGVVELVQAFHNIDAEDWQLHLYGGGSSLGEIKTIAQDDTRIVIHGMVPNSEVLKAQSESEILVNPRNDNNEFTKYSFPSKVIEYLGSGTPMIGYILPGMPKEYYDKFYVVPKEENGLEKCMKEVMNLSSEERKEKGREALEFVVHEKNAVTQGNKIVDFIVSL